MSETYENRMNQTTLKKYAAEGAQTGKNPTTGSYANLTPEQAAEYLDGLKARSDFLYAINLQPVKDVTSYPLFSGETAAGITGRQNNRRHIADFARPTVQYKTLPTQSGIFIPWYMYDQFAVYDSLFEEWTDDYNQTRIALDLLQMGWYGRKASNETNAADLSDVHIGWLAQLAAQKPQNFKQTGEKVSGEIRIFGENADYDNLNELAFDLRMMLDERYRHRNDLVFLVGAELIAGEPGAVMNEQNYNNRPELNSIHYMNNFGGMRSLTPPNFPLRGAVVTGLKNLSIYTRSNSMRISVNDDQDLKGAYYVFYREECYTVEKAGMMAAVEFNNVKIHGK